MQLNEKKIAFISCVNDRKMYDECCYYINNLDIPDGYTVDLICLDGAESMAAGYNAAMCDSDAKYKVYLHQDVFIVRRDFIHSMLEVFNDSSIGMLGLMGASETITDASYAYKWDSGSTYLFRSSSMGRKDMYPKDHAGERVIDSVAIDGMLMATQYDVEWKADVFTGWDFYDISQSMEMRNAGFKVVTIMPDYPFALHVEGFSAPKEYGTWRNRFCEYYADKGYSYGDRIIRIDESYAIFESEKKQFLDEYGSELIAEEDFNAADFQIKVLLLIRELQKKIIETGGDDIPDHLLRVLMSVLKIAAKDIAQMGYTGFWPISSADDSYGLFMTLLFLIWRAAYGCNPSDWSELTSFVNDGGLSREGLADLVGTFTDKTSSTVDAIFAGTPIDGESHIIGIILDDGGITFGDGRYPEKGNPGIGGSEYEELLLARMLAVKCDDYQVNVYHVNPSNNMPEGTRAVLNDNVYSAIRKCKSDGCNLMIFPFGPDGRVLQTIEDCGMRSIALVNNYLEYFDSALVEYLNRSALIAGIACVSEAMFHVYDGQSIQNKMFIANNIWEPGEVRGDSAFDSYSVTYIGGLYPTKGFHILASVWKNIVKRVPGATLNVIGSGKLYSRSLVMGKHGIAMDPYESEFMRYLMDENGNILSSVHFHGLMGIEKADIIRNTSVGVVNPSGATETFCISAVEFESAGVPVVTADVPGIHTTVVDGVTGFLIKDVEQFENRIVELLTDRKLNKTMSDGAREYTCNRFSMQTLSEVWMDALDSIV